MHINELCIWLAQSCSLQHAPCSNSPGGASRTLSLRKAVSALNGSCTFRGTMLPFVGFHRQQAVLTNLWLSGATRESCSHEPFLVLSRDPRPPVDWPIDVTGVPMSPSTESCIVGVHWTLFVRRRVPSDKRVPHRMRGALTDLNGRSRGAGASLGCHSQLQEQGFAQEAPARHSEAQVVYSNSMSTPGHHVAHNATNSMFLDPALASHAPGHQPLPLLATDACAPACDPWGFASASSSLLSARDSSSLSPDMFPQLQVSELSGSDQLYATVSAHGVLGMDVGIDSALEGSCLFANNETAGHVTANSAFEFAGEPLGETQACMEEALWSKDDLLAGLLSLAWPACAL
jgi:hypothetical protein